MYIFVCNVSLLCHTIRIYTQIYILYNNRCKWMTLATLCMNVVRAIITHCFHRKRPHSGFYFKSKQKILFIHIYYIMIWSTFWTSFFTPSFCGAWRSGMFMWLSKAENLRHSNSGWNVTMYSFLCVTPALANILLTVFSAAPKCTTSYLWFCRWNIAQSVKTAIFFYGCD